MTEPPSLEAYRRWRRTLDHRPARVSIITAVRNRADSLERTIQSVLAQTYHDVEHIVIDGGSTDGTLDVIRRHADRLAHWVSEPDRGISDAFNKGVAAASGGLIGLLNADDWMEPDQIEIAVAVLDRTGADFVFGDLVYHEIAGRALYRVRGDPAYAEVIASRMPELNHPTLLARREIYESIGLFDLRYRAAMDYDWLLRAHLAGCHGAYEPRMVAHMTLAGISDQAYRHALGEVRDIAMVHGQPASRAWLLFFYRIVKGIVQRALRRCLPATVHGFLRSRINSRYEPFGPGGGSL